MKMPKSFEELSLDARAVFMRLDLNVPLKDGVITSDARIRAALPSIQFALKSGARLALASHLGRPKKARDPKASLEPVGARLSELLSTEVILCEDCIGDGVKSVIRDLRPGQVALLENLRFHEGEEANDETFARALAAPFEVYVNDAFGASHREHASIVGMVRFCRDRGVGFLMKSELTALERLVAAPEKPFVAVVGGAKVADKVGVLQALLSHVDVLCIGGAMAYTFMKAQGVEVGLSKWEGDKLRTATEILKRAKDRGVRLLLPEDHVVASAFDEHAEASVVDGDDIPEDQMALDIGPRTRETFANEIRRGKTVFWNGPLGVFEWPAFAQGTLSAAKAMAECQGFTVVGGGDSVAALEVSGVSGKIKHVSTGGGASLEFIEQGTLPGITALS